jgi:hypothetical protein
MASSLENDVRIAKGALGSLPTRWPGKKSVLELKAADYHWRQMEWWAFYFEFLCRERLRVAGFQVPGDTIGTVTFDAKCSVNWDLKAHAIKSDSHIAILNDKAAMDQSIAQYGAHGVIAALCDVEYNDTDRSFQQWHTALKGGLSRYEKSRIERTAVSRYRKTGATLVEIYFLRVDLPTVSQMALYRQGRNSNGKPRPTKYMVDFERLSACIVDSLRFS